MIKPTVKQLLPIVIIVLGIIVFILLKATQVTSIVVPAKERSWHVQILIANPQPLSPHLTLYGQVETPALVNAVAPKNSRVTSVHAWEGDSIHKGQLLLTLDERDFKPRLKQAKAHAAELKALIQSEQIRYKADKKAFAYEESLLTLEYSAVRRAKMLSDKKLGSVAALELAQEELKRQQLALTTRQLALDDHIARLEQLKARLAQAQADIEMAQLDLERSQIISPFEGFVEKLTAATGNQVKENQVLLSYYSTQQLEVRAKIPTSFQNEIQKAIISKQPLIATAEYAGVSLLLRLDRISGIADARGVDALFNITSGNEWVRPGITISLSLQRPSKENAVILPYASIYDNKRIYRIVNKRLEGVNVQVLGDYSNANNEKLLVFSPKLQAGDKILTTYLPNAINGLKVDFTLGDSQ